MEAPSVLVYISSLSSFVESHVAEADSHIEALSQSARLLVPPADFDDFASHGETESSFNEEALIAELEKLRLELVMEIQQQSLITSRLEEIIAESGELVRNVTEYYAEAEARRQNEEQTAREALQFYTETVVGNVTRQLEANVVQVDEALTKLPERVHPTVRSVLESRRTLLSDEYKEQLKSAIAASNKSFNDLM